MSAPVTLGFVNVLKPSGPTSTQVGAHVRRIFARAGAPKLAVGHLGTLDPTAAGVLPIALGKATRLIPLLADRRKAYAFTLVLGVRTDSGDASGTPVEHAAIPSDVRARLHAALRSFHGRVMQVPPMVSALHHNGERLYDLARKGIVVERPARPATIYDLRVLGWDGDVVRMRVSCGEGTYVRTLCEDLATAAGTIGHLGSLLRVAAGPFVLYESVTLEELAADPHAALIAPERVVPLPTIVLDVRSAVDFRAGRVVPLPGGAPGTHVFVRDASRALVGVGEVVGALLAPRKVFL